MEKLIAIALIDKAKANLIDPVELLDWVHLRVIINQIPEEKWDEYVDQAEKILSR